MLHLPRTWNDENKKMKIIQALQLKDKLIRLLALFFSGQHESIFTPTCYLPTSGAEKSKVHFHKNNMGTL